MDRPIVTTPCGIGVVWGIGPGTVVVEFDYEFLVEFQPHEVKSYEI